MEERGKVKFRFVESLELDTYWNLALENRLFDECGDDEFILYLWRSRNAVVVGRNQNAYSECNLKFMKQAGIQVTRRFTGGGAVFQDLGNTNFAFVMPRHSYNLPYQFNLITEALKSLSISAEFSGRNDILVEGKKISGSAFYYSKDKAFHHGTLLINSDLTRLTKCLNPSESKLASKAITSVKSRVVNLKEHNEELDHKMVKRALHEIWCIKAGCKVPIEQYSRYNLNIGELYNKYSSWDWIFGQPSEFNVSFSRRFAWGEAQFGLQIMKGRIREINLFSDAMYPNLVNLIKKSLIGKKYTIDGIFYALPQNILKDKRRQQILNDISALIGENI